MRITMRSKTFAVPLYGAIALAPLAGAAQPNPAQPEAPVPTAKYESAFAGYLPFREEKLAPWREINEEVGKVGGHVRMFGGAGHSAHGGAKPEPVKPAPGQPAAKKEQPAGQPPGRSTPPAGHQGH
jgi:hypothetical protein